MMCTGKQEDQGECSQGMNNMIQQNIQTFQDHHFLLQHHQNQIMQQQQQQQNLIFPSEHQLVPPIHHHHQPWPPIFNPARFDPADPFPVPPPPPQPQASPYAGLFARRASPSLHFAYDGNNHPDHHHLRILSDTIVGVRPAGHHHHQAGPGGPFGLQAELGKMTAQEIMDAKALAASKSHSEAERRRRERINNHLAKLRSLLPSTTKTDKASLLAEVIQHVKELKRQTSLIAETSPVPTETDELTVDDASDEEGRFVIKASLCCEDRSDLIPDLIKTLKGLRLRTLKAEITTLGGRVKNVLFVTGDEDSSCEDICPNEQGHDDDNNDHNQPQYCITSIQEALKAVIEKKIGDQDSSSGSIKRQRTANNINIYP